MIIKRIGSITLVLLYMALCGEISIRIISSFLLVYNIEMLNYAKQLKEKSPLPGISHQHRPHTKANLMGVEVSVNSRGHRSVEFENPKKPTEKRIHFLGSSITLGWGVPAERVFASLIETRLNRTLGTKTGNRYVAINAGVGNYNTYYEVETFKRQVDDTNPDMVVLQYYINDAEPNPRGGR